MAKVKSPKGTFFTSTKGGKVQGGKGSVSTLTDALAETAKCEPCGCDSCLGYWTMIDAATGELMVVYIDSGSLVVDTFDDGIAALKVLKANR